MVESHNRMPVDRGWSWVILFGSCLISFLHIGSLKAFGLFFVEFLDMFGASVSVTSLIISLQSFTIAVFALPVLSVGLKFYSVRTYGVIGGILCTVAYGISVFAMNIQFLIFCLSFVLGSGCGLVFPPVMVILGQYFDKRRGFANGATMSASCVGTLVLPIFIRYCMDEYGVRGALLLLAGLYSNVMIGVFLLRPPEFYSRPKNTANASECKNLLASKTENGFHDHLSTIKNSQLSSSLPNIPSKNVSTDMVGKRRTLTVSEDTAIDKEKAKLSTQYLSNISLMSISVADVNDVISVSDVKNRSCFQYIKLILDFSLLKQSELVLFLFMICFASVTGVLHTYIPAFARNNGLTDQQIVVIVCIQSASDFVGRFTCGFLADNPKLRMHHILIVTQFGVSIVAHMSRFLSEFWTFCLFAVLFGLLVGAPFALNAAMTTKIVGLEKFSRAFAFVVLGQTLMFTIAIPILGYLKDVTGTYHSTFHYAGTCATIAALLGLLQPLSRRFDKKRGIGPE